MPINITNPSNQITKSHTAERLEINLLSANEDVKRMLIKVYFNVDTFLGEEKIAETYWDSTPLIFDCSNNPELKAAMDVIQAQIGIKRLEQITLPDETELTGSRSHSVAAHPSHQYTAPAMTVTDDPSNSG